MITVRQVGKQFSLFAADLEMPAAVTNTLYGYRVSVRPKKLSYFAAHFLRDVDADISTFEVQSTRRHWTVDVKLIRQSVVWKIGARVSPNLTAWTNRFSVSEYFRIAQELLKSEAEVFEILQGNLAYGFECDCTNDKRPLATLLKWPCDLHEDLSTRIESHLALRVSGNSVTAEFRFPADVRVACEQYLLHFVDFLMDIGVDARADLHEDANRVLFSVTPKDRHQALERIHAALEVYLSLPSAELVGIPVDVAEQLAMQRLQMNVHHLQAQLAAADARSLLLNVAVRTQQQTIELLRTATLSAAPKDAATIVDAAERPEPILGGLATIVTQRSGPLQVNFPEMYRRLRDLLQHKT